MAEKANPRTVRARNAIMDATRALVSERETDTITLTEIAEAAGVSRPTIYKLFADTTSLVAATAAEFISEAVAHAEESIKAENEHEYFEHLMEGFIAEVYRERTFCRNVMYGNAAGQTASIVVAALDERMRTHKVGKRMGTESIAANDNRAAISAGVVWLLTKWLNSDFTGANTPENMAKRLADTLLSLSGAK